MNLLALSFLSLLAPGVSSATVEAVPLDSKVVVTYGIGLQDLMVGWVLAQAAQSGQLVDGSYQGPAADAYYGVVQVQALVQGGQLASVKVLKYPNDRNTSRYINSQALPVLLQEAVQSQGGQVDIVSGATLTSQAFIQSLAGALGQASSGTTSL